MLYPRRNLAEDGGVVLERIPKECGVDIWIRRWREAETRAVCKDCIAGTRVLMRR